MDQLHRAFANKHYPHLKEYVSKFGNIGLSGHLCTYACAGVDPNHWEEIPLQEFMSEAAPEALVLIDFILKYKRLPNFLAAHIPYEHRINNVENARCYTGRSS